MAIASPCIDVCRMEGRTGYCTGCLRTAEEIRRWRKMTDHQRRRILDGLKQRQAQLDRSKLRRAMVPPVTADRGDAS